MSFVVTIDGPAGAGKSTTARAVAERLGFLYVDTGALYRALALRVLQEGIPPDDVAAVERCAQEARLGLSGAPGEARVWLDGAAVGDAIRTPEVSELASRLAALPVVRGRLIEIQRDLVHRGPLVAEGRDLGTVVFPDAEIKVFLDADLETRARRRASELQKRGLPVRIEAVREELARRDERDRSRPDSPLVVPPGARVVDTSGLTIAQQVEAVLDAVRAHPASPQRSRVGPPPAGPGPEGPGGGPGGGG